MERFQLRKLVIALSMSSLFVYSSHASASAFQLWEQDAASVGNYHAGYAAAAYDASTAFYNPAGMSRFKEQQLVVAGDAIMSDFKYRGTVRVNSINAGLTPLTTTAQGGNFAMIGAMHYIAPYNDTIAFGLSVDVPFGLKVNYGRQTPMQYASTVTSVRVIDISPVVSFKFNNHLSFGIGPDAQLMRGEFDSMGTNGGGVSNTPSVNVASDTAYGFHTGLLYEFNENTRVGLSYHSQVVHHLTGTSTFSGPLAALFTEAESAVLRSTGSRVNVTLPPYTALSAYHKINSKVAVTGSVIYTQWSVLKNLVLQNVAGINNSFNLSTTILAVIPQYFHNSYSVSAGADYFLTDKITLRGGLGVDQTPVNNTYRNVQLPDSTRYAFALGSHFQSSETLGFDIGWTHLFMNQVTVNPPVQVMGAQRVTTNGKVTGGADVFAAQLVWDMV